MIEKQIRSSKDIVEDVKRIVSVPKAENLIKNAELAFEKGNYGDASIFAKQAREEAIEVNKRAKEMANEARRISLERKVGYDLAFNSISEAEKVFNETKNKGVVISTDSLTKSKQAFDNGDYAEAIKLSEKQKNLASDREIKYREAQEQIRSVESSIERAKEFGCNVLDVKDNLKNAEQLFEKGDYEEVVEASKLIEEQTKEIKQESKPEITINLSQTSFKPNKWERINLTIKNSGTATAKAIHADYPKERVEIEGLMAIEELKPNEEKTLKITIRPIQVGEVPLTAKITYRDLDNKEYKEEKSFWINVGEEPPRREREYETPTEKKEVTIERAIYDSCKRDFIERALPRMKEWINRYDPGAYWLAVSIQNNTDTTIEEWGVELETSSVIKIKEARVEGVDYDLELHESHPVPYKNTYAIGLPKEYGIVIPNGGAQRVYFKLRAEKPKTVYEITGVFKSRITGDIQIRAKKFKYWCDAGMPPEAVKEELKKAFSEKDAALLALSFKSVQEIDRMCNQNAKTKEYLDTISTLKTYTEGFNVNFTMQVDEFSRFMEQEQIGYLDDEYKGKVRRFCTNLVDVWIAEFLR